MAGSALTGGAFCRAHPAGGAVEVHRLAQIAPPDTSRVITLEPIVVEALRHPASLELVPYAISVRTREQTTPGERGLGLEELLRGMPGVQIDTRFNPSLGPRISLRGFGARAAFGVRGIRIVQDGIPATLPDGQSQTNSIDVASIARAEVIRGPASALYGNASGGVILLQSETPSLSPISQRITAIAGESGLLRLESATSGTRAGHSGILKLSRLRYPGYRRHSESDENHISAKLRLGTERGEWTLVSGFTEFEADTPGALTDSLRRLDPRQANPTNIRQKTGEWGRQAQLGVRRRQSVPAGEFEISAFLVGRSIDNRVPVRAVDLKRRAGGVRVLFSAGASAGREERVTWTAGLDGDVQRDDRRNFENNAGARGARVLDQREGVFGGGAFVQLGAPVGSRVRMQGALRFDRFRFEVRDHFTEAGDPDDSGTRTMQAFSPSFGLISRLTGRWQAFANYATSFETPTTTELANRPDGAGGFNGSLDPQRVASWEAGGRGFWPAGTAFEAALFRADVSDALVPFEVPEVPGRSFYRNVGSAVHQGLEISATAAAGRAWRFRSAYTYLDAHYTGRAAETGGYSGNEIPGIAPHQFEAGLDWSGNRGLFASLNILLGSRMAADDANRFHAPRRTLLDMRVGHEGLRFAGAKVSLFAGASNLLDRSYDSSIVVNAVGGRFHEPGPGRSLHGGATVGW